MLLPTLAILLSLLIFSSNSLTESQISELFISTPQNDVTFTDSKNINFYINVIESGTPITALARPESEYSKATVNFKKLTKTLSYTFYLTSSVQDCIFKDSDGDSFRIDPKIANELLLRNELEFVYKYSLIPTVTLSYGDTRLSPKSHEYSWAYLLCDKTLREKKEKTINESKINTISSFSQLLIESSLPEDTRYITIYDGDNIIFSGNTQSLSTFEYTKDSLLVLNIESVYYQKSEREYFGNSSLSFEINYDLPASCELLSSSSELFPGSVVALYLKNTDCSLFSANAGFKTSQNPTFFDYKDGHILLLPISIENNPGSYSVVLQSEETSFAYTVSINNREFDTINVTTALSAIQYEELQKYGMLEISKHLKNSSTEPIFKGVFTVPSLISDTWIQTNYGAYQKIGNTVLSSQNTSIVFAQHEKSDVTASNDGKVSFVGEIDFYGNIIIIDHGYGIKTVYCNLLDTNVEIGQKIYKNQVIGRIGQSGETTFPKTTYFLYINETPVNPYSFINNSFLTR